MNRRTGFTISYFVCTWMYSETHLPRLEVLFSIICMNRLKTFWTQVEFKRSHAGHILSFQSCSSHLGEQLKVCPWVRSSDPIISERHPHSSTITFFYEKNGEYLSKKIFCSINSEVHFQMTLISLLVLALVTNASEKEVRDNKLLERKSTQLAVTFKES